MAQQYFMIAALGGTLTNVESMSSVPLMAPAPKYIHHAETAGLISGGVATLGSPIITWTWGYIYNDMHTALRAICTGGSALVDIRSRLENGTPTSTGSYTYYHATMVWPDLKSYEYRAGKWGQPFVLTFRNLTSYTP